MDTAIPDSDGEYEYEYGPETETFYLNLDLTAHHGAVRPPRRHTDNAAAAGDPQDPTDNDGSSRPSDVFTPIESAERGNISNERIQILGLHTCNPIVSYRNQVFACSWADHIGTELVFASPNTGPESSKQPESLYSGPSFELLSANSVKILGRKARIISSTGVGMPLHSDAGTPVTTASDPTSQAPQAGVPRRVTPSSHQSSFLTRLQDLKASRGEKDSVRTVMSNRRTISSAENLERLQRWSRTEAQLAEIHRLHERASRGDAEAQTTLDLIIAGLQEGSESDSEYESDIFPS